MSSCPFQKQKKQGKQRAPKQKINPRRAANESYPVYLKVFPSDDLFQVNLCVLQLDDAIVVVSEDALKEFCVK